MGESPAILFISYHLPLDKEPGAFRPWMEAKLLARAGYRVTVITSGVQYMTGEDLRLEKKWCTEEVLAGVRILRVWTLAKHRGTLLRRFFNYLIFAVLAGLVALLKGKKAGKVFAGTDPIVIMPIVYLVALLKRADLVLDERDLFPETAIASGVIRDGIITRQIFAMQQFFRRHSFSLLAATPGIKRKLMEYGHPERKIHLLYNGDVFLDEELAGKIDAANLRQITQKKFLVGYGGGLGIVNNVQVLLDAARHLRDLRDLGVIVIGSGEALGRYRAFCEEHHLDFVYFLGPRPRWEARRLMCQFDVCVQPLLAGSHFHHTLTSKTFDYHGLGRAMVFCGGGDTEVLLKQSGGGLSVPPQNEMALAEAIRCLYGDEAGRWRMGQAGRRWFEKNINMDGSSEILRRAMNGHEPL